MTASATTKRADPIAALTAAREQLAVAQQERARLKMGAREHEIKLGRADAELAQLARTEPDQFSAGQPKPKTKAAELRLRIDEAASNRWPDLIAGADERVRRLEDEVRRITDANSTELALREFRGGEDDLAALDAAAEQVLSALSRLEARRARLIGITAACHGRLDGRDIYSDPRLDELRRALEGHPEFKPPRSATLTPLVGETPAVLRGRDGGWVRAGHGSDSHAEEQPERVEPAR